MNHLYRSVWNEVTRSFVAVAEVAKARGRKVSSARTAARQGAEQPAGSPPPAPRAPPAHRPLRQLRPLALEPRMMFDAAGATHVVEAAHPVDAAVPEVSHAAVLAEAAQRLASPAAPVDEHVAAPRAPAAGEPDGRKEIVFVENNVPDLSTLLAGIGPGRDVVVLDSARDGLAQMAEYLQSHTGYDALHIVSHGAEAELGLGSLTLTTSNLGDHAGELAAIRSGLNAHADILLYGCDVSAGSDGAAFIAALAHDTGADVAASTDLTGAADKGGDWVLESHTGTIDTTTLNVAGYRQILPSVAGTIAPTEANNGFDFGSVFTDGMGGSSDIAGVEYDFYFTDGSNSLVNTVAVFSSSFTGTTYTGLVNSAGDSSADIAVFKTSAGENFKLTSFFIQDPDQLAGTWTVTAYENGNPTGATQTFTIDQTGEYARTVTLNNTFQNIDEVRISRSGGSSGGHLFAALFSDFEVADPVANTAPVISNLNGDSVALSGTVTLDSGANLTLSDTQNDSSSWGGSTLQVVRRNIGNTTADTNSSDIYSFNQSGYTVSGNNLTSGGNTFATYANSGGVLTIYFNGEATTALVQSVMRGIQYRNDTPNGDATIRFELSDGTDTTHADVTVTSSTIYVTQTADDADNDTSDGFSLREALARSAAQSGADIVRLNNITTGTTLTLAGSTATLGAGDTIDLSTNRTVTLAGSGGGGVVLAGTSTMSVTGSASLIVSADLSGAGSLIKTQGGALTLSGTNTYAGTTEFRNGAVTLNGGSAIPDASALTLGNGASLAVTLGANETVGSLAGSSVTGSFNLSSFTLTAGGNNTSTSFDGVLSGTGGFTKAGSGTLTFSANHTYTGATTINSGGTLALSGGTLADTSAVTVNGTLSLSASETIGSLAGSGSVTLGSATLTAGGNNSSTTFSGAISGTGGLTKTGSGMLSLSGSNTYTGATTVSAGTLRADVSGASIADSSAVTVASGATFNVRGGSETIGSLAGAGTVTLNGGTLTTGGDGSSTTFSGTLANDSTTGSLNKTGAGSMTLSGTSNTYTGTTTVSAGTLAVAGDGSLGADSVTLAAGTTLQVTGNTNIDNGLVVSGDASLLTAAAVTLSGNITGSNTLTKSGGGTVTLSVNNSSAAWRAKISAGTLSIGSGNNLGSGDLTLDGGTLAVTGATTLGNNVAVSANSTLSNSSAVTLSGTVSGSSALTKSGAGTLTLSGHNVQTGGTTVAAGELRLETVDGLGTGTLSLADSTTLTWGATPGTLTNNIQLTGTGTVSTNNDLTLAGVVSGGSLALDGTATVTLGNTGNTYSGTTSVASGLSIASGAALGNSSAVSMTDGARLIITADTTVNQDIALYNSTVQVDSGTSATLAGVISGSNGLRKEGGGTLTLEGANTYSGDTVVTDSGVLVVANDTALGAADTTYVDDGATLSLVNGVTVTGETLVLTGIGNGRGALVGSGGSEVAGSVRLIGEVAVSVATGQTFTVSGSISDDAGASSLLKVNAGSLALLGSNSFSNGLTVNAGTLRINADDALGAGGVSLYNGSTLQIGAATTVNHALSLAGNVTVQADADATLAGELSGYANLTKTGTSTLTLSQSNSYTGTTTVSAGTLSVAGDANLGGDSLTLAGGTLAVTGATTIDNDIAVSANSGLSNSAAVTLGGALSGSHTLTKSGAGTLTLGDADNATTMSGGLTVMGGTLSVAEDGALSAGTITLNGGALTITDTNPSTSIDNDIVLGDDGGTVNAIGQTLLTGVISGSGTLLANGASHLSFYGDNTYTGATTINGIVVAGHDHALGSTAGATTVTDGATLGVADNVTLAENVSVTGLGLLGTSGALRLGDATLSGAITLTGNTTVVTTGNTTLSGVVSGAYALTKAGAGTLTLSGTNTYSGATTVSAGGLTTGAADVIANSSAVTVASGATLTLGGADTVASLAGAGNVALGAYTLTAGGGNTSTTFDGVLSGSGGLTKAGSGTLTLAGNNNAFTGTATLSAGAISIAGASQLGNASLILAAGTLEVTGSDVTLANTMIVSGNATIDNDHAVTLSGDLAGSGALTKAGAGTLTVSGASSVTGDTTVTAGTLSVTGSLAGGVNVNAGGTLAGTGSVGAVWIDDGATLAPGVDGINSGVGTLTLNGDLTLMGAGTVAMDINGTVAGTSHDQLVVNGGVALNGGTLSLTMGYTPGFNDQYTLIANDGSDALDAFGTVAEGGTLTVGGVVYTAHYAGDTGNDFVLSAPVNATPVISNLDGHSVAWAGAGNTVLLDASGIATVADTENDAANWNGASLSVQRSGTALSADVFGFNEVGFTVSGNALQSSGHTFATFTNTGGVLTISFTGTGTDATNALVQSVLRGITYRNDTPAADATVRFSLSDGSSATTADVVVTSDRIDVTNTADTAAIDLSDGVSFSEAVAIAAADTTGTQTLVLSSAFAAQTVALDGTVAIGESLTLDADAANNLSLTGGISIGTGRTLTVTNGSGDRITFGSYLSVSGDGGITKTGAGTLGLYANNTYTGNTVVSGGTLQVVSGNSLGTAGTLTLDGGTLNNLSNTSYGRGLVIGSGGGTISGGGAPLTFSGTISGPGVLTLSGPGDHTGVTLSGTNTHAGTVITTGTVFVTSSANLGSGSVTLAGGNLSVSGSGVELANALVVSSDATLTNANGVTLSGQLSGTGTLTKAGSGTLTLSNTGNEAAASGGITVNAGTLSIADDDALSAGTLTMNGGGLQIRHATTIDNAVVVAAAGNIETNFNSTGGVATLSGVLSGSGALSKNGPDTLVLSGANTHTGAVNVNQAVLRLEGGAAIGDGSAVTLGTSATLELGADETIGSLASPNVDESDDTPPVVSLGAHTLTVGGNNSSTGFDGSITGTGGLVKTGTGTFSLTYDNTYTGATTVAAGELVSNRLAGAIADSSAVTVAAGATFTAWQSETVGSISGDGTVTLNSGTLTVGGNNSSTTFSGNLAGDGSLTKAGTGTLTLTNTGNEAAMSGGMEVRAGTLAVTADDALSAGTLTLNGGTLSVSAPLSGDTEVDIDNAVVLGVNGGGVTAQTYTMLGGVISGSGNLALNGTNFLALTGANTYTGDTVVYTGLVVASGATALGSTAGGTTVMDGATLAVISPTAPIAENLTLSGSGAGGMYGALLFGGAEWTGHLTLAGDTLILSMSASTISGDISGDADASLTFTGDLTLAGTHTYSGATTVMAGTVNVTGSLPNTASLTVADGATLAGTGSIGTVASNGAVTVQSGGTLAPGVDGTAGSIGTLTLNDGLLLAAGSTYAADVAGTTPGVGHDQVVVHGDVTLNGGTLSLAMDSLNATLGQSFVLIDDAGSGAVTGHFAGLAEGATVTALGNRQLGIGYAAGSGNDVVLQALNALPTTNGIANQSATEDGAFSFTVPGGAFADADTGDHLTLTATLASGAPLPSWLSFDPGTGTFSGTPANGDVGAVSVRVVATDLSNATAHSDFTLTVANTNDAPTASGIANQSATEDAAFSFAVPGGTFADIDTGDSLTLTATLTSGAPLPSWLSFDPGTGTFSGTPANGDVGAVSVRVIATDLSSAAAHSDFTLTVANTNDAPTASVIANQSATEDAAFSFAVPGGTFADIDVGDHLTLTATLTSGAPLPTWLSFDAGTGTFSGTPANGDVGTVSVRIIATDGSSASAHSDFTLTVANTNDAPTTSGLANETVTRDNAFSFALPAHTFADVDVGDTLTLSATLAGGAPLPSWLHFDANTGTFSGLPASGDVGAVSVRVTATDGSSASAHADFTLTVSATNTAPTTAGVAGQTANEDSTFSFALPAGTFADADTGDTLTLRATLADGSPLPAWLSFNAATGTFSGTPANGDVGALTLRVTATDGSHASVHSDFTLTVANTNDAPTSAGVADQAATQDAPFQFTMPLGTFADVDVGDHLTLTATQVDGSALPTWLHFDAASGTFSGTPANGDVGTLTVRVTATDGSQASAHSDFHLTIANVDDAPQGSVTLAGTLQVGQVLSASTALTDADGIASVALRWQQQDSQGTWTDVAGATGTTFTLGNDQVGKSVRVVARVSDVAGGVADVASAGSASVTALPVPPAPAPVFVPPPAPAPVNPPLSSPPAPPSADGFVRNTALDTLGGTSTSTFGAPPPASAPPAPAPEAPGRPVGPGEAPRGSDASSPLSALPDLGTVSVAGNAPFQYTLPPTTFQHADASVNLTVEVRQADGRPLPAWLKFDPATGTLSGQPPAGFKGVVHIRIVARDAQGHAASSRVDLDLSDRGPGGAPDVGPPLSSDSHGVVKKLASRPGLTEQLRQVGKRQVVAERLAASHRTTLPPAARG